MLGMSEQSMKRFSTSNTSAWHCKVHADHTRVLPLHVCPSVSVATVLL